MSYSEKFTGPYSVYDVGSANCCVHMIVALSAFLLSYLLFLAAKGGPTFCIRGSCSTMAVSILSGDSFALSKEQVADEELRERLSSSSLLLLVGISAQDNLELTLDRSVEGQKLSANSTVDAIFQVKRRMDEAKLLNGVIYVPTSLTRECEAIKNLLFMETFEVAIRPFPFPGILKEWKTDLNANNEDYEVAVTMYLTSVPSIGEIRTIQSELLPSHFFRHGFTTRYGGISTHPGLASLSITYSKRKPDSPLVAKENKRRLCQRLGIDPSTFHLAQVEHGNSIWIFEKQKPEKYDGIVTNTPGITIAAPGADCMMILLADPVAKACGAVHAGFAGVLAETLKAAVVSMREEYQSEPANIVAIIGPSLGHCCADYVKGLPFGFQNIHADVLKWQGIVPYVNLKLAARKQLEGLGVLAENIDDGHGTSSVNPNEDLASCTKCGQKQQFFSHRRDGVIFGNQIGFISLLDKDEHLCTPLSVIQEELFISPLSQDPTLIQARL